MDLGGEEAIAAFQDEQQFFGDEDDFDDLYGDVNVGEGFHLSNIPNIRSENHALEAVSPAPLPPPLPPVARVPEKVHVAAAVEEARVDRPSGAFEQGFREGGRKTAAVAEPSPPPVSVRPVLGQNPSLDGDTPSSGFANGGFQRQVGGFGVPARQGVNISGRDAGQGSFGGTTLFVGELPWWTTDSQLEEELCKYGQVKEMKFFEEKASGKSKGYCQVDFYDPMAAAACKDNMNGHLFNGRPCVVAHASPATVRRMGEAQLKNNGLGVQPPPNATPPRGRGGGVGGGGGQQMGGNYGRGGGGSGNGGWGRGGRMGNARNRMGPVGGRGIMGSGAMVGPPPMMHPGPMMGQGFDPTGYGAAMGRMAGPYGGFLAGPAAAPFPGMMTSFPPGVNPHMNPAFFGRGGLPPGAGGGAGMWPDPNMGGWAGEEQSSYGGDDAASEQHYGEANYEKDRDSERDRSGAPGRRHEEEKMASHGQEFSGRHYEDRELSRERDREKAREKVRERDRDRERDRERERERERHRDDRDRHGDHRLHPRHRDHSDDRDRTEGRSSRPRSRSRELEFSKRRRLLHA